MKDWLYYRIYAKPVDDWYSKLLKEVVKPFVSENETMIDSFFFLHYHHPYGVKPYDNVEAKEPKFKVGDEVWFIRLRILAEKTDIPVLETNFKRIISKSQTVLEIEECSYNEKADLGVRFGEERRELVRKYLEYASRITLSLLDQPRNQEYQKKLSGLIHLPSNMLEFAVVIKCEKCGNEIRLSL